MTEIDLQHLEKEFDKIVQAEQKYQKYQNTNLAAFITAFLLLVAFATAAVYLCIHKGTTWLEVALISFPLLFCVALVIVRLNFLSELYKSSLDCLESKYLYQMGELRDLRSQIVEKNQMIESLSDQVKTLEEKANKQKQPKQPKNLNRLGLKTSTMRLTILPR